MSTTLESDATAEITIFDLGSHKELKKDALLFLSSFVKIIFKDYLYSDWICDALQW